MYILLTGASSFIGRNIKEYLLNLPEQYTVIAPSHVELDLLRAAEVESFLKEKQFDIVIHAGMYNREFNHPDMLDKSLRMFYHLARCGQWYGRMFYFGSGAEFDKTQAIVQAGEEDVGRSLPQNYYGFAKYLMNEAARASRNIYNLRLFGVYGPYEDWKTKFISNMICRCLCNKELVMNQNMVFDYLYVKDFLRILERFLLTSDLPYQDYNVCRGMGVELLNLANLVRGIDEENREIQIRKPGYNLEYTGSNKRLMNFLGAFSFTPIVQGVRELYDWYQENRYLIDLKD